MTENIEVTPELEEKGYTILKLSKDYLMSLDVLYGELSGIIELSDGTRVKQTVTIDLAIEEE